MIQSCQYLLQGIGKDYPLDFEIKIEEKNRENYLSAGEMPLPALYQVLVFNQGSTYFKTTLLGTLNLTWNTLNAIQKNN